MTFGLRNAGQTFQRFIDEVLQRLDFCFAYIDDILVFSSTHAEHRKHLRTVFQRLADHNIVVEKSVLGADSVTFLGHRVSATASSLFPIASPHSAIFHSRQTQEDYAVSWVC